MSDAPKEQLLVNLRPHVVEVHLPDRVITVGPMGSAPISQTSPQVDELVRRGLLVLRDLDEQEQREQEADGPAGEDSETGAADGPAGRRTGRGRGSAAAKRGGN